jgi:hypothetical protein
MSPAVIDDVSSANPYSIHQCGGQKIRPTCFLPKKNHFSTYSNHKHLTSTLITPGNQHPNPLNSKNDPNHKIILKKKYLILDLDLFFFSLLH